MNINIPSKFDRIISSNQKLHGALKSTFSQFSDWISDNKLEFFPEFTDHGIGHINSVLRSAEEIMSEASYNLLTANDVYVLCTSILLHDCAMHLNRDGLWDLLQNQQYNGMMLGFDNDLEWKEKWNEFRKKVDRFTEPDWINLYSRLQSRNHYYNPGFHLFLNGNPGVRPSPNGRRVTELEFWIPQQLPTPIAVSNHRLNRASLSKRLGCSH